MKLILTIIFLFFSIFSFSQNNYDQLVEEGLTALQLRDIPTALIKYKAAYQLDSTKVEVNYGLGVAYQYYCLNQGANCFSAIFHLSKAIDANGNYRNGYFNRGSVKNAMGNFEEAINDFNMAIKINPDKSNAYFARSLAYSKLNKTNEECDDLKRAAELGNSAALNKLKSTLCN